MTLLPKAEAQPRALISSIRYNTDDITTKKQLPYITLGALDMTKKNETEFSSEDG